LLGVLLRKAAIGFVISVRPSIQMEQLVSHWVNFHKILYLSVLQKSIEKIELQLKFGKSNGYFAQRPMYVYDSILPSSC
jgi:hypothetical protein